MSADNYLYVGLTRDGKYGVEMRFASSDYGKRVAKKNALVFDSAAAAIKWAHEETHRDYYEYGVSVTPEVLAAA